MATPKSPNLAADAVPIYTDNSGHLKIVLGKRANAPYKSRYSLPGVLVVAGENLREGSIRALRTKASVVVRGDHPLRRFALYDAPARDKRGPTVSVADIAVIDPDTIGYGWEGVVSKATNVGEAAGLPFDHDIIVKDALKYITTHLWDIYDDAHSTKQSLAQDLLGDEFTTTQMANLLGDIDPLFNTTNTNRLLKSQKTLTQAGGGKSTGGRAPTLWRFKTGD